MRFSRRGASLVEVLVALGVFGLITSLIAGVFVVSHRYTRVSQQVSRAQREAARCMQAFYAELSRAHSRMIRPGLGIKEVWFLSSLPPEGSPGPGAFADNGELLWQKWVGIWCQSDGMVYRSEIPLVGGPKQFSQLTPTAGPTAIISFTVLANKRRIAAGIREFQVQVDSRVATVDVESETSNAGNLPTRYHLSSSFLVP